MSYFGSHQKDAIVDAMIEFQKANQELTHAQLTASLLEAFGYGLEQAYFNLQEQKCQP